MLLRRKRGRKYIHMYLYNYYIIFIWGVSYIFIITSGHSEIPHQKEQLRQQQQEYSHQQNPNSQRKALIKEAIKSNLLRLLNLKEVPKPPTNKAYVPVDMLREYVKYRDLVRLAIPNDRDFFGKINLDDLHPDDHNFWNELSNKYSHGIEIDMTNEDNDQLHKKFQAMGDVTQVSAIQPEREPEEIDPRLEPILPPHSKHLQQFSSVHIKFNLSQEMYQKPYGPNHVKGAILTLNREKLLDCHVGKCDRGQEKNDQWKPGKPTTNRTEDHRHNIASGHYIPFYQRLFINPINGYDEDGTPRTYILHSQRIDTRYSTPITYDISGLVREWLRNPDKNYGIIVRITNDDPEYDKYLEQISNASTTTNPRAQDSVFEHVRLKRGFRSASDAENTWLRQKPLLTLFLDEANDGTRHNVKRADQLDSAMEGAQADAPDSSADAVNRDETYKSGPSNGQSVNGQIKPKPRTNGSRSSSVTRRPTEARQSTRNPSNRTSPTPSQRPKGNKARTKDKPTTKCGRSDLTINFDEVGWSNWIIAPSSYAAGFCTGDCAFPLTDYHNSTNHAIIQAIFHSVGRNVPRTCCAPTKLGRMAILYQLERSVQMKYYDDMIVESCGCL